MTTSPPSKRQKSTKDLPYTLIYWPSIPGRGEFIRLLCEEAGASYKDVALTPSAHKTVLSHIDTSSLGDSSNPPPLAPPILQHGDLTISQAPNILLYIARREGLAGIKKSGDDEDESGMYRVNQLVLTALDGFCNEVHDTHHPIAISQVYEDQKEAAKQHSHEYLSNRLPKFLGYFERVLKGEPSQGGEYLYGGNLTVADLVLWQGVNGTEFAFPKRMAKLREGGEFKRVFELCERVGERERVKEYLGSERRMSYGMGIWRRYKELDEE